MLKSLPIIPIEDTLWQREGASPAMGCSNCGNLAICGGLSPEAPIWNCRDLCCGSPHKCNAVCPVHSPQDLARRMWEVNGWTLDNVRRVAPTKVETLPHVAPMIYHGSSRSTPFEAAAAAVPLHKLYHLRSGRPRWENRAAIESYFRLAPGTPLIIDGINKDHLIEPSWSVGRESGLIEYLRDLRPAAVTTPNFSVFCDVAREDNFHNMKRIALLWAEAVDAGLPAALHLQGRTDQDFKRWTSFVADRPEVTLLSFEFGTGTSRVARGPWYAKQLAKLASSVPRPLRLIVRGRAYLPLLIPHFKSVTLIDTCTHIRSMKRQRFDPISGKWEPGFLLQGQPVDGLLQWNWDQQAETLRRASAISRAEAA